MARTDITVNLTGLDSVQLLIAQLTQERDQARAERDQLVADAHQFDDESVTNPATGKPYGPGPLWAGTEPMDYPDPLCRCGAPWLDGSCSAVATRLHARVADLEAILAARDLARCVEGVLGVKLTPWQHSLLERLERSVTSRQHTQAGERTP